jgi:hypothetical protein
VDRDGRCAQPSQSFDEKSVLAQDVSVHDGGALGACPIQEHRKQLRPNTPPLPGVLYQHSEVKDATFVGAERRQPDTRLVIPSRNRCADTRINQYGSGESHAVGVAMEAVK